jgi:hypothetical protein
MTYEQIAAKIYHVFKAKNNDYGDSVKYCLDSYGEKSALTRIADKFKRLESLILKGGQQVHSESIQDTVEDMANYCIMFAAWLSDNCNHEYVEDRNTEHDGKCYQVLKRKKCGHESSGWTEVEDGSAS